MSVSLSPTSPHHLLPPSVGVSYAGLSDLSVFDLVEGEFDGQCLQQAFLYAMDHLHIGVVVGVSCEDHLNLHS